MTAQADPIVAVADQYNLTAAEVVEALAALRKSKTVNAAEELRRLLLPRTHNPAAGVDDPAALVSIANDRVLEIQQATTYLVIAAGLPEQPAPSALLQRKVRALQQAVDRIKTALAQSAASPQLARFVRDSRAALSEVWAAIDALSEVK
jgi:hypothetical protein